MTAIKLTKPTEEEIKFTALQVFNDTKNIQNKMCQENNWAGIFVGDFNALSKAAQNAWLLVAEWHLKHINK